MLVILAPRAFDLALECSALLATYLRSNNTSHHRITASVGCTTEDTILENTTNCRGYWNLEGERLAVSLPKLNSANQHDISFLAIAGCATNVPEKDVYM